MRPDRYRITLRLEAWAHAAAEAGVEYRFPLLDRRVMELCLGLPESPRWLLGKKRATKRVACGCRSRFAAQHGKRFAIDFLRMNFASDG